MPVLFTDAAKAVHSLLFLFLFHARLFISISAELVFTLCFEGWRLNDFSLHLRKKQTKGVWVKERERRGKNFRERGRCLFLLGFSFSPFPYGFPSTWLQKPFAQNPVRYKERITPFLFTSKKFVTFQK